MFGNLAETTVSSLEQVWADVVIFVPTLLGIAFIFVVGLIVSSVLGNFVQTVFKRIKLDEVALGTGIEKEFERVGMEFSPSRFLGRLTYWFLLIVTLILVVNSLFGPGTIDTLLEPIFAFIPRVAAAVIILLGSVLVSNFLKRVVQAAIIGAKLHLPNFLGTVAWWSVMIFGILAALEQLQIGSFITAIASTAVTAILFGSALAFGIAFGLGGKEAAAKILEEWRNKIK